MNNLLYPKPEVKEVQKIGEINQLFPKFYTELREDDYVQIVFVFFFGSGESVMWYAVDRPGPITAGVENGRFHITLGSKLYAEVDIALVEISKIEVYTRPVA